MSLPPLADARLAALQHRVDAIRARTRAVVAGLDAATLNRSPGGGGWSLAQLFEHLRIANLAYERQIDRSPWAQAPAATARTWRRSFWAGLLLWSLRPGNGLKLPAPVRSRPGPAPAAGADERFLATLDMLSERMRRLDGRELDAIRMRSPLAKWMTLNVGDALEIMVTHAERHMLQAERIRAAVVPPDHPRPERVS